MDSFAQHTSQGARAATRGLSPRLRACVRHEQQTLGVTAFAFFAACGTEHRQVRVVISARAHERRCSSQ